MVAHKTLILAVKVQILEGVLLRRTSFRKKLMKDDELYFIKLTDAEAKLLEHLLHNAGFTHFGSEPSQASVHDVLRKVEHALYHT